MVSYQFRHGGDARPRAARPPGFRSLPVNARLVLLIVEAGAVLGTAALLFGESPAPGVLVRGALLLVLGIGYAEVGVRSQRLHRFVSSGVIFLNPMSAWFFAAVLVLPAGWAALFVATQYAHSLVQRRRERSGNLHRVVYSAAVAMCAQLAAAGVVHLGGGGARAVHGDVVASLFVLAGVPAFMAVNLILIVAGMWLSAGRPTVRSLLPRADTVPAEAAALCLGIAAAALATYSPVLLPVALIPVVYAQRSAVVNALRHDARTDSKTGLLTHAAWIEAAQALLQRSRTAGSAMAVLLIDIDRFKLINDHHGHLTGDKVLAGVADCLRRELRGRDPLGRFGGEEFVAVLSSGTEADHLRTAHRLRAAVAAAHPADVPVTVSVGVVTYEPADSPDITLDQLLEKADAAQYEAKAAGRDRVCRAELVG